MFNPSFWRLSFQVARRETTACPRHSVMLAVVTIALAGLACTTPGGVKTERDVAAADGSWDLSNKSGTPLERFDLKKVDGTAFSLDPHLGKDVLMVTFWATWCAPCKTELARMAPVYERLKEKGFVYIAIATDGPDSVAQVRPYVSSYGYGFPVLLDSQSAVLSRYNPRGDMPFYLLVNRRGEIVEQHQGFTSGDEVVIEQKITSLLGNVAP